MQLVIDFFFYLYVYNSTCFKRQALIIRSPSPYIQPSVSVFVSAALSCKKTDKTVPQTDTNTETGGCMYGEGLLMMSAWRSKHVELYIYIYIYIENIYIDRYI
jgi:hypothetical protein